MIIKDMTGYTLYVSKDGNSAETVMNGDNEGHNRAWQDGYCSVDEVEYWLAALKQDRAERDRKAIGSALSALKRGHVGEVL